jgi:ABC-2 type transport system permease protein
VSDLTLALRQVRYENLAFWRNPAAAFFTFAFPLMFLVIFNLAFGNESISIGGGRTVRYSTFIVPAIITLSIVNTQYTSIAMRIVFGRDAGLLKRVRGTPLPAWSFILGTIVHATLVGLLLVVITIAAGALFYGVSVPTTTLPALVVTLIVAAAGYSALGLAITTVIPNADAAPAIVNFSILPLYFLSNVFIRIEELPAWLDFIRELFPIIHTVRAVEAAFSPATSGSGMRLGDLAFIALWGVAGAVIAARFFSWEPRR